MRCNDCGTDLDGVTLDENGLQQCPVCGKAIIASRDGDTQSFSVDNSRSLPGNERYQFLDFLGEGAFGIVFKAFDHELRRFVAVKTPKEKGDGKRVDLFLREARAASRLRHPNLVSIYDVVQEKNGIYIVSEYIEGQSLRAWMDNHHTSFEQACRIVIQICEAIEYAHEMGVIHRDIKPANIVMDKSDNPHLLDFGLSFSRQFSLETIGVKGVPIGTPAFMAPEQVVGDSKEIDRPTDVYATGVILYQFLTGKLPFHGNSSQLFTKILNDPPARPRAVNPAIPASLEAICLKAMAKQTDKRYQTAGAMAEDLQKFLDGKVVQAYGKIELRTVKRLGRRGFAAGLATTLGAGLLGTSWWIWNRKKQDNPYMDVVLEVEPNAASIWLDRINEEDGEADESSRIIVNNGDPFSAPPGFYKVTVSTSDERYFVYRTIPKSEGSPILKSDGVPLLHRSWQERRGKIVLPRIKFKPIADVQKSMIFQAGGRLQPTRASMTHATMTFEVKPYLIDATEVTYEQFNAVFPEYLNASKGDAQSAIVNVDFELALAYAEVVGKQIPTAWQWLWAATNGGLSRFPWGDKISERPWPALEDREQLMSFSTPPVAELYSNVLEWADTPPPKLPEEIAKQLKQSPYSVDPMLHRGIVGGPLEFAKASELVLSDRCDPMQFGFEQTTNYFRNVGFRCVREI